MRRTRGRSGVGNSLLALPDLTSYILITNLGAPSAVGDRCLQRSCIKPGGFLFFTSSVQAKSLLYLDEKHSSLPLFISIIQAKPLLYLVQQL